MVIIDAAMASRTASAPCPASGGCVLLAWPAVTIHRRQVQQHGEPGGAFHEGANRRAIETND
jgi:hypothetical protein